MIRDPNDAMSLQTNFGQISVCLGTAPVVAARIPAIDALAEAIDACRSEGAAIYTNSTSLSFTELSTLVASQYPQPFSAPHRNKFRIRYDPLSPMLVTSSRYQPLHCDNAHRTTSPDLILLHFEEVAHSGGESTLLRLKRHKAKECQFQCSIRYRNGANHHTTHLFLTDHNKTTVHYNPFFDEALFESHDDFIRFKRFVHWAENIAERETLRLREGQCLLINNRKTLHGRAAFRGHRVVNRLWFNDLSP